MKKTDIAMIIFIASTSVIVSFLVAKVFFGDAYKGEAKVKTIERIQETIDKPSSEIFYKGAINPSVKVEITDNSKTDSQ